MSKQQCLEVDMHIDDLANFMFVRNVNNALVELSLGGIENNKDLFFFCLDLFCKGLVLLFGENGKVDVESLTEEKFNLVKQKMHLAGIDVKLDIYMDPSQSTTVSLINDNEPPDVEPIKTSVNINELDMDDDNKPLSEYVFRLRLDSIIYNIHFDIVHNT
jgi:hypothetical protein